MITSLLRRINSFRIDMKLLCQQNICCVGFSVLTAAVVKSSVFWDKWVTLCSQLQVDRRFGETCRLHLQGGRISQATNQQSSACHLLSRWFITLYFEPENGGDMFLRNDCWLSTDYTVLYPREQNSPKHLLLANGYTTVPRMISVTVTRKLFVNFTVVRNNIVSIYELQGLNIVTCYLRSQPIQRFIVRQQLHKHATVLEPLLSNSLHKYRQEDDQPCNSENVVRKN
jgi:hypothetical protein